MWVVKPHQHIFTHQFRTRLGFKQKDAVLTKEKFVLTKIMSSLEGERMEIQYNVLDYRIDLYFHDYKLRIKINENRNRDRNIVYKIKRQKVIVQELGCKIIRIDPNKGHFLKLSMKYLDKKNQTIYKKAPIKQNFNYIIRIRVKIR